MPSPKKPPNNSKNTKKKNNGNNRDTGTTRKKNKEDKNKFSKSEKKSGFSETMKKGADKAQQLAKKQVQEIGSKIASVFKNQGLNAESLLNAFQGASAELLGRYQDLIKSEITGDRRLVKAVLFPKDSGGKTIRFMFNPTQLNFSRSVVIKDMEGAVTSAGIPKVNFAHVNPWQLKLSQILFDTYEDEKSTSVLEVIQPLIDAVDYKKFNNTQVGTNQAKRPPVYYFTWGENNYLKCMVTDMTYNLTMFLPNGRPVRATVDISLKEVDDSPTTPLPPSPGSNPQNQSLTDSPNTEPVSPSNSSNNQGSPTTGATGSGKPGAAKPGAANPGAAKPGPGKPGLAKPGPGKPGPGKPGPGKPGPGKPGPGKPGAAKKPKPGSKKPLGDRKKGK